jgi:CRP-like cAMP-binding protein
VAIKASVPFDPKAFLAKVGEGRSIGKYRKNQPVFAQGEPADAVFFIQKGKVKITVLSEQGKEAVVAILGADDFFGEGCLAGQPRRMATVTAMTECGIMRLEKAAIIALIHDEPTFSSATGFRTRSMARATRPAVWRNGKVLPMWASPRRGLSQNFGALWVSARLP